MTVVGSQVAERAAQAKTIWNVAGLETWQLLLAGSHEQVLAHLSHGAHIDRSASEASLCKFIDS